MLTLTHLILYGKHPLVPAKSFGWNVPELEAKVCQKMDDLEREYGGLCQIFAFLNFICQAALQAN